MKTPCRQSDEQGMTLVEVMIVLAIIGVAAGAVSLGIGSASRETSVRAEATRLAERLQLAADQAMVDDRQVLWLRNQRGYRFAFAEGDRSAAPQDADADALMPHRLPAGMRLDVSRGAAVVPVTTGDRGGALSARLSQDDSIWEVRFDGLTASAIAVSGR
jgi:general secretion pathway protein H